MVRTQPEGEVSTMDITAALTALQTGSLFDLSGALDWDDTRSFTITMPEGDELASARGFVGRLGLTTIMLRDIGNEGVECDIHAHIDEADAAQCWSANMAMISQMIAVARALRPGAVIMDEQSVSVPDYVPDNLV